MLQTDSDITRSSRTWKRHARNSNRPSIAIEYGFNEVCSSIELHGHLRIFTHLHHKGLTEVCGQFGFGMIWGHGTDQWRNKLLAMEWGPNGLFLRIWIDLSWSSLESHLPLHSKVKGNFTIFTRKPHIFVCPVSHVLTMLRTDFAIRPHSCIWWTNI